MLFKWKEKVVKGRARNNIFYLLNALVIHLVWHSWHETTPERKNQFIFHFFVDLNFVVDANLIPGKVGSRRGMIKFVSSPD